MAETIMVIDDELDILFFLRDFFNLNNYEVIIANSAEEASKMLSKNPDIILLDINMPQKNGLDFCKQIRSHTACPIIFLTARTEPDDILTGLMVGGDDYITKPFDLRELLGRIQAHLRREKRSRDSTDQKTAGLRFDYSGKIVYFNNMPISLTKTEFEIVEFLSMHPGQVFDMERIYENVIGLDSKGDNTVIREHIRKIRKKFMDVGCAVNIETVWGFGYKWVK